MKTSHKSRLILGSLVASLALNGALLGYLTNSGGLRRIFLKMDLVKLSDTRLGFQKELESKYRKYPNTAAEIVFAGDSLIGDGPWAEFYSNIRERGIGGDTTQGMLGRIDEILASHPKKLFLLLGTNDLRASMPAAQFLRNYRELLGRIRKESPATLVHVIGILPHHADGPEPPPYDNAYVVDVDRQLKELVAEFPGVIYIDLSPFVADKDGTLRHDLSKDGTHLNVEGYLAIREHLEPFVLSAEKAESAGKPN